jgi:hypothetical protein
MLNDVEATLGLAAEQLGEIEKIYNDTLAAQNIPPRLQALIKGVIEHQRSALDFTTHAIATGLGTARDGDRIYWPYARRPEDFVGYFDKNLPGLRAARPDIADAYQRYQPYTPGYEWIADLIELAKSNKHRQLTPQTRTENHATRFSGPLGGAIEIGRGASIQIGQGAAILIDGVPLQSIQPQRIVYVAWLFADSGKNALGTLQGIQAGIEPLLHGLCNLAGL